MPTFSGNALRRIRVAAGIRPERLAVDVGRSTDTLRGYEHGRIDPPASVVGALAGALNVEPGDLFDNTDSDE